MAFPALRDPRFTNSVNTGEVLNRMRATLGGLQATMVGAQTITGTGNASLGGLTGTMTGLGTAFRPTLNASLGGLHATMVATFESVSPTPVIFTGKYEFTRRTTDADPAAYARNLQGNLLMRHYGAQPRGVNIYVMLDGTITENDPLDWGLVDIVLWGAHETAVSDELAQLLVAAGYGAYLSALPPHLGYQDIYSDIYV